MTIESHNKLVSFIWNIADDCLRDVYNRCKYRDVILPMIVLRRLDALLESTKEEVLEEAKFQKEEVGLSEFDPAGFTKVTGYVFYNTSKWTLTKIYQNANNNKKDLENNLIDYLNGFSSNVQEIVRHFSLKQQITKRNNSNILLDVLERFISPKINLTPESKVDPDGRKLSAFFLPHDENDGRKEVVK